MTYTLRGTVSDEAIDAAASFLVQELRRIADERAIASALNDFSGDKSA